MEINNLFGLPAHPLLVHIPVVLVPLATIGSLLVAVRGSWRRTFAIPVAVVALIGTGGVFLATKSGSSLEERVDETDLVHDHAAAGERAEPWAALYGILAVGLAGADWIDRRSRARTAGPGTPAAAGDGGTGDATGVDAAVGGTATATATTSTTAPAATTSPAAGSASSRSALLSRLVPVLAVVTLLSGCVASYFVYEAGHSGAKATWNRTPASNGEAGEGGESGESDGG